MNEIYEEVSITTSTLKEIVEEWWDFADQLECEMPDWLGEIIVKLEFKGHLFNMNEGTWERIHLN